MIHDLSIYLAGFSFAIAMLAVVIAIMEHYRAERVEQGLLRAERLHAEALLQHGEDLTKLARQGVALAEQDVRLNSLIQAVAAASAPPSVPVGKAYIVVPGPGTQQ